jgi:hypothetical protein
MTTLVFENFMRTPLREYRDLKLVPGVVPGVGQITLDKLKDANIDTVDQLLGQLLLLRRNTEKMMEWLQDVCDVRGKEAKMIAEAMLAKAEKISCV